MKKKSIFTALLAAAVLLMTGNVVAQNKSPQPGMAMSLSILQEGLVLGDAGPVRVNVRAMRDFKKRFTGKDANWTSTGDVFLAKFSDDTIRTVVGYGKQGRWLYTIKHYSEKDMPGDLRHMVKSEYYDFKIDLINEVRIPQSKNEIYIIHMHNEENQHKILRFSDEGIELVKSYSQSQ